MRGERGVNNENVKLFTILMFLFFAVSSRSTMKKRRTTMAAKDWMMGGESGIVNYCCFLIAGNVHLYSQFTRQWSVIITTSVIGL